MILSFVFLFLVSVYNNLNVFVQNHRDNHQMSHDATESENKDEHRKCEECNVIFYNEKALNYHYRSIHKR